MSLQHTANGVLHTVNREAKKPRQGKQNRKDAKRVENDERIKKLMNGINQNKHIKLRQKYGKGKGYSLYLDRWNKGIREYEYLELFLQGKNTTRNEDKQILSIAMAIRDERENAYLKDRTGFQLSNQKENADFFLFINDIAKQKNHQNWYSCIKHLRDYGGKNLKFTHINKKFINGFKEYLLSNEKLEQNTAYTYFSRFRTALNIAVEKEYFAHSPASLIRIQKKETTREYLEVEELEKAIKTPARKIEVKNAFLFSCYTGLRVSDIRKLTFEDIHEDNLSIIQTKTKRVVNSFLSDTAKQILKYQKELRQSLPHDTVFKLPKTYDTVNTVIREWMKDAGINKDITYHCSRHTFGTMCYTSDVDLYTIKDLMGHTDVKTTQIYAKIVEEKRRRETAKLPKFTLSFPETANS